MCSQQELSWPTRRISKTTKSTSWWQANPSFVRQPPFAMLRKSWFLGRGWGQQLFSFQSPAVHWMARTSSLNCLSCRKPYQTPHSVNCLPLFTEKPFFSLKSASLRPLPTNRLRLRSLQQRRQPWILWGDSTSNYDAYGAIVGCLERTQAMRSKWLLTQESQSQTPSSMSWTSLNLPCSHSGKKRLWHALAKNGLTSQRVEVIFIFWGYFSGPCKTFLTFSSLD